MKRGKQVLAALMSAAFFIAIGSANLYAAPIETSPVLIAEVQTGSTSSASQEFIELVNVTAETIDVSDWRVEYFSAGANDFSAPSRVMPLSGVLPAGAHYLLATAGYLVGSANDSFGAGLAATGGHVRLVQQNADSPTSPFVKDLLGWGSATHPEVSSAKAPEAGKSLQRKVDAEGNLVDTNNNADDFEISSPSPEGFVRPIVNDEPEQPDSSDPTDLSPLTDAATDAAQPVAEVPELYEPAVPIEVTELLPNPASPQTDAADEFIELYNPTAEAVSLDGYKIQTGNTYNHSYEFNEETLAPSSYAAFYVSTTGAVLANSGGKARLLSPAGEVLSETAVYDVANDGMSWSYANGTWQWSTTPTPNAPNTISQKPVAASSKKPATKSTKKASTKKTTAKKAKATKASVKGAKTGANGSGAGAGVNLDEKPQVHTAIIAGVGALALGYAGYEYRRDIFNLFHAVKSKVVR